ncbi:MAG: pilus assembly protein PilM [Clostridia bacterium]|nr:pilus assembly protein PilM [Clostridia bacterium]
MVFDFLRRKKSNNEMICIDIGYKNIKVVEVDANKSNSNIHISNYGITATPKECIKNGAIYDVSRVLDMIKQVIYQQHMKAKNAKIIMSGTNIITRIYLIDKKSGEESDDTIKKSIPGFFPLDIDNYQIDYKILQTVLDRGVEKYKVFLTAVPKKILQSYVEVLRGLDLKPLAVDIPANSTAKFFNRDIEVTEMEEWYRQKVYKKVGTEAFAVLDFGSETTIVNFLNDKILEFNKVILCGSSNIDEHLAKNMDIRLDEAEWLKKKYGLKAPRYNSPEEHYTSHEIITDFIERLVKQIANCFIFYQEHCYGKPISKVFIIGGGSQLAGLRQYLFSVFNIPVYPVGLMNLRGVELEKNLDQEKLNYLINCVGISL